MPLTQLATMMNVFQSGIASLERVLELLDAEEQTAGRARAGRRPAGAGTGRVRRRVVRLRPEPTAHRGAVAHRRAGPDDRHRRAHRRRQDHARQPDHALLRARLRLHHPRRRRHRVDRPVRAPVQHRHGAAGHVAVRRDDPRQHRLRQPVGHRGADPRGGRGHLRRSVRVAPARRLRLGDQRRGRQHQRRPEAADHDRPRLPRRPARSSSSTRPPARSTRAPRSRCRWP